MNASIQLYPWQAEAVERLRANIRAGVRNQVLASPTGSGKTLISAFLLDECYKKGKRAVFVADRVNLIDQTSAVFDTYGIPHGVIQSDHWRHRPWERIQIASAQTLARRAWPHDLAMIVVDEAHTVHKTTVMRIGLRDCVTIGLSATPFTRGLGRFYDAVVTVRTTNQLIADEYLTRYRIFAASEPDMTGARVVAGEWTEDEAERRSMPIIGDIVTEYLRHAMGRKFIAFGVNVKHCEEIQRQMMAAGVPCGLYTHRTGDAERALMIRDFKDRDSYLRGLVSVAALAKGFDNPAVEVIIEARPLRTSLAEHIQILGRGLRRDPENPEKECLILDHAGNCVRFWSDMQDFFENGAPPLDMGKKQEKKKPEPKAREPYKCPRCAHVHQPRPMCPACGHEYPRRSEVQHVPGYLSELTSLAAAGSREDRQSVYSQLLYLAHERGYRDGWAAHKFHERFGSWPDGLQKVEATPTRALEKWVRSLAIAYAKTKQAVPA